MLRHTLLRHSDNSPLPSGCTAYAFDPLSFPQSFRLTNIVDSVRRTLVRHSKRDCGGNILYVPARPSPLRLSLIKQNNRSPIIHPLHILKRTMILVTVAIYI